VPPLQLRGRVRTASLVVALPAGTTGPLRADASAPLRALKQCTVAVVDADGVPACDFVGELRLRDASAPGSAWDQTLAMFRVPVAGEADLSLLPVTMPAMPGTYRLGLQLAQAPDSQMQVIEVIAVGLPLARLVAVAPDAAARVGERMRLVFEAQSVEGGLALVPQALLDTLRCAPGQQGVAIEERELLDGGTSAAVTVSIDAAPGQVHVRLAAVDDDAAGGSTAPASVLAVAWDVSLEGGPPAAFSVACAMPALPCGAFAAAQGGTIALELSFTDLNGYPADAPDAAVVQLHAPPPWLQLPSPPHWSVQHGAAALEVLQVTRDAPLGRHKLDGVLLPRPPKPGASKAPPASVRLIEFNFSLQVQPGRFAAALALDDLPPPDAPPLCVEAGAPVPMGIVRVLDAAGAPPPPPFRSVSVTVCAGALEQERDPRLHHGRAELVPAAAADGDATAGRFCCAAGSALTAPTAAGDYSLLFRYEDPAGDAAGAPVVARRRLRVVGAASGPLHIAPEDASQLPGRVCVQLGEATGLLAPELGFVVRDGSGNAVDLSLLLGDAPGWRPAIRFASAAGAEDAMETDGQPAVLADAVCDAFEARLQEGRLLFTQVRTAPDWPCGTYRVWLEPRLPVEAVAARTDATGTLHAFEFVNAAAGEEERHRAERAAQLRAMHAAAVCERAAAEGALRAANATVQRVAAAHRSGEVLVEKADDVVNAANAAVGMRALHAGRADALVESERARQPAPLKLLLAGERAAPRHVAAYARIGTLPQAAGGLGASLADGSDVLCMVHELLRAERPGVGAVLATAAGAYMLGTVVARTDAGAALVHARLGHSCVVLQPVRAYQKLGQQGLWGWRAEQRVDEAHPQAPLLLPPVTAPGFVGYLVNLVHLTPAQLAARLTLQLGAAHSVTVGLRASVLWCVYRDAKLFADADAMMAYDAEHPTARGALWSLNGDGVGRSIGNDALEYGKEARSQPRFFAPPGVPWAERRSSSLEPELYGALAAVAAAEAAASDAAEAATRAQAARDALAPLTAALDAATAQAGDARRSAEAAARAVDAAAAEAAAEGVVLPAASAPSSQPRRRGGGARAA
jgi:hypothetical protein